MKRWYSTHYALIFKTLSSFLFFFFIGIVCDRIRRSCEGRNLRRTLRLSRKPALFRTATRLTALVLLTNCMKITPYYPSISSYYDFFAVTCLLLISGVSRPGFLVILYNSISRCGIVPLSVARSGWLFSSIPR